MHKRCNRRFSGVVRNLALVATLLPALFVTTPPATAGDGTTCAFDSDTGIVTIEVALNDNQVAISRDGNNIEEVNADCSGATRFNTKKIVVNDAPDNGVVLFVLLSHGFLGPGTNEPGNSDEIEIEFNSGNGNDSFNVHGSGSRDVLATGIHFTGGFSWDIHVNLNAGETTGVDHDVTLDPDMKSVAFQGFDGSDRLSGDGGLGTGSAAFGRVVLYGGDGDDTLIGGVTADSLDGANGDDVIKGGNGDDDIGGGNGKDTLKGQKRDDSIEGNAGNDRIEGGPGTDDCSGGGGVNTISGCED